MKPTKSLDKFRIHQLLASSQHSIFMIDEDINAIPLKIDDIPLISPSSQIWGSIYVENLKINGISTRFIEFVRPTKSLQILTTSTSNPANLADVSSEEINIEFNIKNRLQAGIDEDLTLILPSIINNILVVPVNLFAFRIQKHSKVHYQLRYNNLALQNTHIA
ncbi:MAG: hypothetical protein K8S87_12880 [Planctomycetes bacterium]|nr:hypothetical protein [Planctomycetota bacterium]